MVRTSNRLARIASGGSTNSGEKGSNISFRRSRSNSSSPSSIHSSPSDNLGNKTDNPTFIRKSKRKICTQAKNDENGVNHSGTIFIRGFYITKKDIEEAGCSKHSQYVPQPRDELEYNKENFENNEQLNKRIPMCVNPTKTVKRMKSNIYKNLAKFETLGRGGEKANTETNSDMLTE
nr:uncharacterized protein LOC111419504 [Onthophagus taurus]